MLNLMSSIALPRISMLVVVGAQPVGSSQYAFKDANTLAAVSLRCSDIEDALNSGTLLNFEERLPLNCSGVTL